MSYVFGCCVSTCGDMGGSCVISIRNGTLSVCSTKRATALWPCGKAPCSTSTSPRRCVMVQWESLLLTPHSLSHLVTHSLPHSLIIAPAVLLRSADGTAACDLVLSVVRCCVTAAATNFTLLACRWENLCRRMIQVTTIPRIVTFRTFAPSNSLQRGSHAVHGTASSLSSPRSVHLALAPISTSGGQLQ